MPNFNLIDDSNFKYKVGDTSDGINQLPVYNSFKVYSLDLLANSSTTISSHGTSDVTKDFSDQALEHGYAYPVAIVGIDASIAYYITIQKFYLTFASDGTATIHVRLANTGSGSYTCNRLVVHILCALRTNDIYLNTVHDSVDGGSV